MKNLKKSRLCRIGSAFLAAAMVFTCAPQNELYALAEEIPAETEAQQAEPEKTTAAAEAQQAAPEEIPVEEEPVQITPVQSAAPDVQTDTAVQEDDALPEAVPNEDPPATPDPIEVENVTLNHTELTIQKKKTADLTYTITPGNADNKTVTFQSSNDTVATVAPTAGGATITAVSVGQATITATASNGKAASCKVDVTPIPVESVTITGGTLDISDGLELKEAGAETKTLTVVVSPDDADNQKVLLRDDYNKDVIDVDYNDTTKQLKVTAKKGGRTSLVVVSAENNRIHDSCEVAVIGKPVALAGISAKSDYPKNLYEDGHINLRQYVIYNPADATDKSLIWYVDGDTLGTDGSVVTEGGDRAYADVDQNGRVTAKWKETDTATSKEVTIVAASKQEQSKKAEFKITIKRTIVSLNALYAEPKELVLEDSGDRRSRTISVALNPLASTDREITASVPVTDGKSVVVLNAGNSYDETTAAAEVTATADAQGRVYFTVTANELEGLKKQDTCAITFRKKDANLSLSSTVKTRCDVTVNKYVEPVDELNLQPETLEIKDGETVDLKAAILPLKVEDSHVAWTVDDPEIVSLVGPDDEGKTEATLNAAKDELSTTVQVKADMVGTCTITATAAGNVQKTCTVTVKQSDTDPATGLRITSADGVVDTDDNKQEIFLKKGDTYTLTPTVLPDNAANKKVKWTSESPGVASVEKKADGTCVVTANELGRCLITAKASGEAAACTRTVQVNVAAPYMEVEHPENWSYTPDDQPVTETELRNRLHVSFYPITPGNDVWTLGTGEANDYRLLIMKEDGKTTKNYEPSDMETPGVKTLVISFTDAEGETYQQTVAVEMKEFTEADLISVTPLGGSDAEIWNVPNATPASSLPLAKSTEIIVGRDVVTAEGTEVKRLRMDADITWDVSASGYDPSATDAQEFTVVGEVVLPDYVHNPGNVSLRVQARVHVREQMTSGKKTGRPVFSVLDGETINNTTATVPYGTKIVISTVTDEAEIYYMIDRRPEEEKGIPQDEEHRYSKPIELTSRTTTIYAIAVRTGYDDSICSECTFKLIPAEEVDPDDPDAPLPDDVTDEDKEQIGGKVPDGLWAAVQAEEDGFDYTGKAIKPAVHVYDNTVLLTERTDYTLAYSNNINAGSAKGSAKPPTITVTGRGNYEGKAVVYFTIKPRSLNDDTVFMDENVAAAYNGKVQKPNPVLTCEGKKLAKNRDYTYTDVSYTEPGVYKITVEGIGNYEDSRTLNYEIYKGGVAVSKLTVSRIANQKYTGKEIRPTVEVKYKNTLLSPGTEKGSTGNYWIKYENCTKVGNASVVIVGKGNYKGSKRINFKILPVAKISQAGITLDVPAAGVAYTGKPYTPACTVNYAGTELQENRDYKLSYQNNVKAGKATVVITGMGPYTGTVKKTFKILQNDISGLSATMGTSFTYEKGGCKPKPEVLYDGMKLQEGTDYTLSYRNNNRIGNTASVTIKGKGNYKGQIVRYFEVTMQDLSELTVVAADKAYQRKANIYRTRVQVIDLNGQALKAGTDYAKDIYYTYENGEKAGQPVLSTDIIPVGTVIGVDVRVATPRCYRGTAHGTYRIVQTDLSGARVIINPQEYTGRSIRPKKSQIQVVLKGVQLRNDDYEIVGYENNIKQGNAKITIRGVGSYGGTKTATFRITRKGILNLKY